MDLSKNYLKVLIIILSGVIVLLFIDEYGGEIVKNYNEIFESEDESIIPVIENDTFEEIGISDIENDEFVASYRGGVEKLHEFVNNQFVMPKAASELGISGIVQLMFLVDVDGTISNITIVAPQERRLGYGLEQECMRVILLTSGKWKPALKDGKPIKSQFRFPFQIDNSGF